MFLKFLNRSSRISRDTTSQNFLQNIIIKQKMSINYLIRFYDHNFGFVDIDYHVYGGVEILENS